MMEFIISLLCLCTMSELYSACLLRVARVKLKYAPCSQMVYPDDSSIMRDWLILQILNPLLG